MNEEPLLSPVEAVQFERHLAQMAARYYLIPCPPLTVLCLLNSDNSGTTAPVLDAEDKPVPTKYNAALGTKTDER